jgi:hypothetical protein
MGMRDFERLEELSSTVRSGLEANSVIWAIDRALGGEELDQEALRALEVGRDTLEAIVEPNAQLLQSGVRRSQNMLGSEGGRTVRRVVLAAEIAGDEERANETIGKLAAALDAIFKGQPAAAFRGELEVALDLFAALSEFRLGQAGGITRARRDRAPWLPKTTISHSS